MLKYHETYEEVYDHLLLALETRPQEKFFESTINTIITEEFGGIKGLHAMEKNCKAAATSEVQRQYWRYFFSYFKFPNAIYIAIISAILAYTAFHVSFKLMILSGLIWIIGAIMTPTLLYAARRFKISYKLYGSQKLLKDRILGRLVYKPFQFIWWYFLLSYILNDIHRAFNYQIDFDPGKNITIVILIIVAVTTAIHSLSFIRLIKDEFKISMIR